MTKEIDLVKLQNIVEPVMKNNNDNTLRCRGCNKPLMSFLDAYSCECRQNKKQPHWKSSNKKKKMNW